MPQSPAQILAQPPSVTVAAGNEPWPDEIQITDLRMDLQDGGSSTAVLGIEVSGSTGGLFVLSELVEVSLDQKLAIKFSYLGDADECRFVGNVVSDRIVGDATIAPRRELEISGAVMLPKSQDAEDDEPAGPTGTVLGVTLGDDIRIVDLKRAYDADAPQVSGHIAFDGSPLAIPGDSILIRMDSRAHDGVYRIDRVHHRISGGDWETEVEVTSSEF